MDYQIVTVKTENGYDVYAITDEYDSLTADKRIAQAKNALDAALAIYDWMYDCGADVTYSEHDTREYVIALSRDILSMDNFGFWVGGIH